MSVDCTTRLFESNKPKRQVSGIIAGLVGCVLLGIATAYLLRVPYESALGVPVVVGGIAGGLLPLINVLNDWGFMLFLGLWQGAYAASLAGLLPF